MAFQIHEKIDVKLFEVIVNKEGDFKNTSDSVKVKLTVSSVAPENPRPVGLCKVTVGKQ